MFVSTFLLSIERIRTGMCWWIQHFPIQLLFTSPPGSRNIFPLPLLSVIFKRSYLVLLKQPHTQKGTHRLHRETAAAVRPRSRRFKTWCFAYFYAGYGLHYLWPRTAVAGRSARQHTKRAISERLGVSTAFGARENMKMWQEAPGAPTPATALEFAQHLHAK